MLARGNIFHLKDLTLDADIDAIIAGLEVSDDDSTSDGLLTIDWITIVPSEESFAWESSKECSKIAPLSHAEKIDVENDRSANAAASSNSPFFQENVHLSHQGSDPAEAIVPLPSDVLFGKGGRMKHPGNQMFRAECQRLAPRFLEEPSARVKNKLATELVCFILNQGGRFLIHDRNHKGQWRLAELDLACKKAKQILADKKKQHEGS